ncbi:UxaA family hydrolase [Dictyobacter formicarum]|uniref:Galactarate dehydratase n=1 Tax=Dictyobacter formicarum TaxID=2778368 RepID=A0ABQ3VJN9_9CHLR|nr:altronate dehydratase family protein [Dictyobacter formicarum]GHO86290.1 galactarate dehydratase [Dictyobacter formicarum]
MDTREVSTPSTQLHTIQAGVVARGKPIELNEVAILLHPQDDVAIARVPLSRGVVLRLPGEPETQVEVVQRVLSGHKVALHAMAEGQPVRRYGSVIGFATQAIQAGEHVHSHNLSVGELKQDYQYGVDVHPVEYVPDAQRRTFMGYRRPDGRVGTRNYVAIISSVNCSASTVRAIQRRFGPEIMRAYPNIDGVIGLTHKSGCGMRTGSAAVEQLQRVLAGMALHPNVGAYLLVGLGCESNQLQDMIQAMRLDDAQQWKQPHFLTLQENHGVAHTIAEGARIIEGLLPRVNAVQREEVPISELKLALQCGGSDGWSGITSNPGLGFCVDELVRQGGTAVLSETPEIYGAEHILLRRARSREVGEGFVERLRWWEHYTAINDMEMNNNPSPGNKLGGLTTIYEKSLGAIAKGGTTPLNAVYTYAQPITERGLVVMDTPGYDPVSATGQVAGGCNMIVFTTGRGSMFGFKPAPSIKVSSNTALYENMPDDIDIDAGVVLDGVSLQEVGQRILDEVIAVASGKQSKSEAQGLGEEEFAPWILGATM